MITLCYGRQITHFYIDDLLLENGDLPWLRENSLSEGSPDLWYTVPDIVMLLASMGVIRFDGFYIYIYYRCLI